MVEVMVRGEVMVVMMCAVFLRVPPWQGQEGRRAANKPRAVRCREMFYVKHVSAVCDSLGARCA